MIICDKMLVILESLRKLVQSRACRLAAVMFEREKGEEAPPLPLCRGGGGGSNSSAAPHRSLMQHFPHRPFFHSNYRTLHAGGVPV